MTRSNVIMLDMEIPNTPLKLEHANCECPTCTESS